MKIMLSGANGFIGSTLVPFLIDRGFKLTLLCRIGSVHSYSNVDVIYVDSFNSEDLTCVDMSDIDCFIHLAAVAHVADSGSSNRLNAFRNINTESTITLANIAAAFKVKRFIFLSSIGVYGSKTIAPVKVTDPVQPVDDYSISKLEAEIGLRRVSKDTKLDVVIIRPPLVYGYNAPGKFGSLVSLVSKKLPLPFGAINNKRSFVSVYNLVDFIFVCIEHPNAANQTFLISDDEDISTTDLLVFLKRSALMRPMLIPIPVNVLYFLAKIVGKEQVLQRLCGDFEVDIKHTKEVLGWKPLLTVEQGISRCFRRDDL